MDSHASAIATHEHDARASAVPAAPLRDVEQQTETASFGMWLFLLTEIMFFGGLFYAYLIYRNWYYPAFVAGVHQLNFAGQLEYAGADHVELHHGDGRVGGRGRQKSAGLVADC